MADTTTVTMTGSWVAVAGPGWATITPHRAGVEWAESATTPGDIPGHFAAAYRDRAFEVETKLHLKGSAGVVVTVTRETAP